MGVTFSLVSVRAQSFPFPACVDFWSRFTIEAALPRRLHGCTEEREVHALGPSAAETLAPASPRSRRSFVAVATQRHLAVLVSRRLTSRWSCCVSLLAPRASSVSCTDLACQNSPSCSSPSPRCRPLTAAESLPSCLTDVPPLCFQVWGRPPPTHWSCLLRPAGRASPGPVDRSMLSLHATICHPMREATGSCAAGTLRMGNAMAAYLGRPVAAALAAVRQACVTADLPCALRLHRWLCGRLRAKRLERCAEWNRLRLVMARSRLRDVDRGAHGAGVARESH